MHDLSATMFYKAKFTVTAKEAETDLLWTLLMEIKQWLTYKWNVDGHCIIDTRPATWTKLKYGGKLFDAEQTNHIYAESARYEDAVTGLDCWACKIVEKKDPVEGYAQRVWTTEIGYESADRGTAMVSYVVTYYDMPGFLGFCEDAPTISVPRVIRALLGHDRLRCTIGPNRLRNDPVWLKAGDFPMLEDAIFDPEREVPLIYISPCRQETEEDLVLPINPIRLAKSVAANAVVCCSTDPLFAEEMRECMDARYGCPGGAIRVYRPKVNCDDPNDRFKHRYISAAFLRAHGEECVLDIFRRALAQDVHYYETMFRLESCRALQDDAARKEKLAALRSSSETQIDEAYQEYLAESDLREEAERRARVLKEELDLLKSDNYNLQIQVDVLRRTAEQARQIECAGRKIREINCYPDTPQAIAAYFQTVYPERLVFTDRALHSMDDCVTKSSILWEIFYHMATELYDLLHEDGAHAYKEFTARTGWDCSRGMGTMTRMDKNLMRQYVDEFDGQEINIEAHIKSGNKDSDSRSVRVYFAYDPQITDRIIIGHCGKHLDNYSTRKVK